MTIPDFGLSPSLIWGVFTRLLGVVFLITYLSLARQLVTLVGAEGITPVRLKLGRIRQDFPGWRRFAYFPSLLWLNDSDRMLRLLMAAGLVASVGVIYGGPAGFGCLLVCYLVYLSLDVALRLAYPWECVIFEAALLGLLLPETLALPALEATAAPAPALAWAFRLLLFRVVFGFGKFKFQGSSREDLAYLKSFMVNQPLPTKLAWYGQKLPLWSLKAGVVFLFLAEIPGAALTLIPGWPGLVGGALIAMLMVGIQLSGNFGYFNVIVLALCVPLLDSATPLALDVPALLRGEGPWAISAFVAVHALASLVVFPLNTYSAHTWMHWPFWLQLKAWATAPVAVFRALHPLRWVHPYGVFPPKPLAGVRCVAVVEVSYDGEHWHELEYRYAPTRPESPPRVIAPHQSRWDQQLIYETYGTNDYPLVASVAGSANPYGHARRSDAECLLQRLLEGHTYEGSIFKRGTFPAAARAQRAAPKLARMRTFLLEPTTHAHRVQTGEWWHRELLGPHLPARSRDDTFWQLWLPTPEVFHWDNLIWKRRSTLRQVMQAAHAGRDAMQVVTLGGAPELPLAQVETFWDELLPLAQTASCDWSRLPQVWRAMDSRYDAHAQAAFERVAGRLMVALGARLEPLVLGHGATPELPVPTYFHLGMLTQHIITRGRATYEAVYAEPRRALELWPDMTFDTGMYLLALFRRRQFIFESQKIRLLDMVLVRSSERDPTSSRAAHERKVETMAKQLWGVAHLTQPMRTRFTEADYNDGCLERYPEFIVLPSGEIVRREARDAASVAVAGGAR